MKKIALLTSAKHSELIPDDRRLLSVGRALGAEFVPVVWDRPCDWQQFHAAVVRTPWDYVEKKEQFLSVLRAIAASSCRLLNPLKTQEWNLDKRYLLELQERGLAVPKTVLLSAQDPVASLQSLACEVVVKPVVSAGGFETHRIAPQDFRGFDWQRLPWDTHVFMAQEFLPAILTEGEYSLVYFAGRYSHALRKTPKLGEFRVQDDHGGRVHPWEPSEHDLAEAQAIVNNLPVEHVYCRVDLARHPSGRLLIMEIELIEPELFFRMGSGGEERFVQAIVGSLA